MTGERVAVTSNGREYTWRGTRWTYEPKNNHGRTEVHRTSRLHFALCELASLRAQVAALAGDGQRLDFMDTCELTALSHTLGLIADGNSARQSLDAALDAARGGEG